jgi:peptide/nickel transport system substrate-binding protein
MPTIFLTQPDGTVRVDENYLESAELTSTDPQKVTYTLREDATWSDGTPITWEDFRAQWQALNGSNAAFQIASDTGYNDIASVERGSTDKQAVVTFGTLFSDWQSLFSPLYPATVFVQHRLDPGPAGDGRAVQGGPDGPDGQHHHAGA